jgi:hypothetical protein
MYDIVFISYNELNADENWSLLKHNYPTAKRVNGVKGIHQAHINAAKKCFTKMFWVVDADAQLADDFLFRYEVDDYNLNTVHVWRSINPVNGLEYGYGGVKLLPLTRTLNMSTSSPDVATSISQNFKAIPEVSNVTAFNTDPFSTWRSAFRECAKLSSQVIDRQNSKETLERLHVWTTEGKNSTFGGYAIAGALAGKEFGLTCQAGLASLDMINDFDMLRTTFDQVKI